MKESIHQPDNKVSKVDKIIITGEESQIEYQEEKTDELELETENEPNKNSGNERVT